MDLLKLISFYNLRDAISKKDHAKVQKLLQGDVDVNVKDANDAGQTLLHIAVEIGDLRLVRMLLDRGARNEGNFDDETPLMLALKLDSQGEIYKLLEEHFKDQTDPATATEPECSAKKLTYKRHENRYQTLVGAHVLLRCQPRFKTEKFRLTFEMKEAGSFKDVVLDFSSPLGSYSMFVQVKEHTMDVTAPNGGDKFNLEQDFKDYIEIRKYYSKLFNRNFSTSKVVLVVFTSASAFCIRARNEFFNDLEPFDIASDDLLKNNALGKGFSLRNNDEIRKLLRDPVVQQQIEQICAVERVHPTVIATDFVKSYNIYYMQADAADMLTILLRKIDEMGSTGRTKLDVEATVWKLCRQIEEYRDRKGPVEFLTEKCDFLEKAKTYQVVHGDGLGYARRPGTSIAGQLYETKLLGLILNRLIQTGVDFKLGSNVDGVGQFDDLVVRYYDQSINKFRCIFVEATHRDDPDRKKITLEEISNTQADKRNSRLNLQKNFKNFLLIRELFSQRTNGGIFQGSFDEIDIELAIFTNAKCDFTPSNQAEQNPLLKTNAEGRALQIEPSGEMIEILYRNADVFKVRNIFQNEGKDVNEQNCKSLVKDFFKSYKIYYNQANEAEVGEITMKEIGTDDHLLYLMYHDSVQQYWRKINMVKFLTKECDFLEKAKLTNLTEICFKFSQRLNLGFSEESFLELGLDKILADEIIINVCSKVPILSMAKICQHMKLKFEQSLAIVDFDQVGVESGEIFSMFLKPNEFKCLIVRSSKEVADLKQSQLGTKLAECGKYIILISEAALMPELHQVQDLRIDFADLTTKCQSSLMESKMVSFQGRPTKLVDLIGAPDENGSNDPDRLITGAILLNLLENGSLKIAPLENKQIPYFIARRFKRMSKVTSFQTQELFEIFDDTKSIQENLKDLAIISETKEHFDEICSRYPLRNVHWFKQHEDHFLWQCSSNSVANLRDVLQYDDEEFLLVNYESFSEPVVIIADEPGMGKSTLMTQLEQHKEISSLSMVIRINLIDYTSNFRSVENKTVDFEVVKRFLLHVLQKATPNSNSEMIEFEQILLERFLNQRNVVLLADGFDEIAPHYVGPVLNFLNTVKEHVMKLIVTTRDNSAKVTLENSLNVFAHSFVPFTENDIRNFLEMFWKSNLTDAEWNQARFEEFVTAMLEEYTQTDFNGKSFISTPLHIEMIATCLQEAFEDYMESGSSNILNKLGKEFNLCSLYEKCIEKKFTDIYLGKMSINASSMLFMDYHFREMFEESHTRLALYSIFDGKIVKSLLSKEELFKIGRDIQNIVTGKEKCGFISRIENGKPQFTYLTFAEFFVAKAVWKWLKHYSIDLQDVAKVLLENLIGNDRRQICHFIQTNALSDCTPAENATDLVVLMLGELKSSFLVEHDGCRLRFSSDYLLSVVEHCLINPSDAMRTSINLLTDDEKMSLLHSSAKMGYSKLVRTLVTQFGMDFLKKSLSKNDGWKYSPLNIATCNQNYEIVISLVREFGYDVTWIDKYRYSFCSYLLIDMQYDLIQNLLKMGLHELGQPYANNTMLPLYDALCSEETPQNVIEMLLDVTDVDFFNENYFPDVSFYLFHHDLSLTEMFLERGFLLTQSMINWRGYRIMPSVTLSRFDGLTFDAFNRVWIDRMRFLCEKGVGFNTKLPARLTEIHCILKLFQIDTLGITNWVKKLLKAFVTCEKCNEIVLNINSLMDRLHFEGNTIDLRKIMDDIALEKIRQFFKDEHYPFEITSKEEILRVLNLAHLPETTDEMKNLISKSFDFLTGDKIEEILRADLKEEFLNPELHLEISTILSKLIQFMTDLCTKWRNIMTAIENDDLDGIRFELESLDLNLRKSVINSWDDEYGSPLHFATFRRNYQITKFLLENGANPNSRTDLCCTPKKMPFDENVNKIIENEAVTPMFIAAAKGDLPIVKLLHENGGCLNAKTFRKECTPMNVAEAAGHSDVIEYLVENGTRMWR